MLLLLRTCQSLLRTYAQLLERVKELEAKLASSTAPVTEPNPLPHDASIAGDESSVDAIASNAFNETPEKDIGYFGKSGDNLPATAVK
jgi:hypothetical protein